MAVTYEPIASQTLGSSAASVTFSDVPSTYTDLVVVISGTANIADIYLRFNSDTGSNYSNTYLFGNGSSALSGRDPIPSIGDMDNTTVGVTIAQVMSYANASVFKTTLSASAIANASVFRRVMLWRSTAAITSVQVATNTSTFNSGCTFSLYGIKAA